MKKILLFIFLLTANCYLLTAPFVQAAECSSSCTGIDECQRKIEECTKLLQLSVAATKPHEEKLVELQRDVNAIESNIAQLVKQIEIKKNSISKDEDKLSQRQKTLDSQVRDFYKKDWQSGLEYMLVTMFSTDNVGEVLSQLAYRQSLIDREKKNISGLVVEITDLSEAKKKLEETQIWLAGKKASLEITLAPIKKLVAESKSYQGQLTTTVGALSARQQQLLAEKTGNFSTSVGDVPDTQDENSSIDGFRRNAAGGSFAGFSFGAPHRKGMSQYGSYGRAKEGQSVETILNAYYPGTSLKKDYSTSININVSGYGSFNVEDYVKRIYEVPNSWGDNGGYEALKAQAVAARSYALAYTNNGSGSICATESCQVFQPNPKGGNWERAVNDTRGWVLISGDKPHSAWYAASSGGYNTPGGWDTKCGNQGCWTNDAYEKIASSPWFYKAWYKPRFSSASRSNAWLSAEEFTDIVNAVLLYVKDNGTISHLSQTDKPNGDTWSRDEVRNRLGGEAVSGVGSVSVTYSTGGYTSNVNIDGRNIDGGTFRQIFNIRAPGEIWLASTLYNLEKK